MAWSDISIWMPLLFRSGEVSNGWGEKAIGTKEL